VREEQNVENAKKRAERRKNKEKFIYCWPGIYLKSG